MNSVMIVKDLMILKEMRVVSNRTAKSKISDKIREKLVFFVKKYKKGQIIDLRVLATQIEAMDKRFDLNTTSGGKGHKGVYRLASYLREYRDELVEYENGKWVVL